MNDIKAVIADDEAPLRQFLRKKLSEAWPELVICGEAQHGTKALELIEKHRPQIAFLDIKMPGLTGMEVAEKIAEVCRIVFVTAYDEYAVEAFEKAAVDYLLKPVSRERLEKTVQRLKKELETGPFDPPNILKRIIQDVYRNEESHRLHFIRVQHGDGVRLIPVDDVIYFKSQDKYTLVITQEGESLIRKSMRDLAEELDPKKFTQIHRGTIVNICSIAKASRSVTGKGVVKLKDRDETLTVSHRYMRFFRQM